jgi:hypothetical protein
MLPIKKILFPSSFWGIFDFFVFFNNFGKKNKRMLRYNGGTSVTNILSSSARNKTDVQNNDTREKSSGGQGC